MNTPPQPAGLFDPDTLEATPPSAEPLQLRSLPGTTWHDIFVRPPRLRACRHIYHVTDCHHCDTFHRELGV